MKKILSFIIALFSFLVVLPGMALAQEELIGRSVISGYYAIWNYPDRPDRYQAMPTGSMLLGNLSLGQSVPSFYAEYGCPFNVNEYTNIHVKVKNPVGISSEEYQKAAVWNQSINYSDFQKYYLNIIPDGFNVGLVSSETQYQKVRVKWDLNLNYVESAADLKNDYWRNYYIPTWGSSPPAGFNQSTLAWLWSLPVTIEWYGTPKGKHDLQFTDAIPQLFGDVVAGKTMTGNIGIKNLTNWPTIASYTKFRVYTWQDGDSKPVLNNTYTIPLNGLATSRFNFSFKVPPKPFKLLLTANIDMASGSQVNEFLQVYTNTGPLAKPEEEYIKNKVEVPLVPAAPDGGGNTQPANLAVTSIKLFTSSGSPVYGTLKEGQSYKVKVAYSSSFTIPGYAEVGLYYKDSSGNVRRIGDNPSRLFAPKGAEEKEWSFSAGSGKGKLIAVINLKWQSGETFLNQKFEGQTETTYIDNKMEQSTTVSDGPMEPPPPGYIEQPLYYHPVVTEMIPIYRTEIEQVWIPDVKKIRYIKDDKKARVRSRLVQ